jgi:hypothetical protein
VRSWVLYSVVRLAIFAALMALLLPLLAPWLHPAISTVIAAVMAFCISYLALGRLRTAAAANLAELRATAANRTTPGTVQGDDEDAEDALEGDRRREAQAE